MCQIAPTLPVSREAKLAAEHIHHRPGLLSGQVGDSRWAAVWSDASAENSEVCLVDCHCHFVFPFPFWLGSSLTINNTLHVLPGEVNTSGAIILSFFRGDFVR